MKNRVHLDVDVADLEVATAAAEASGAHAGGRRGLRRARRLPGDADPEGNEFCFINGPDGHHRLIWPSRFCRSPSVGDDDCDQIQYDSFRCRLAARLSQADYVSAAFEVADERGLQLLTLKALGQHLGVDSTAVYRHFRSKDVLLLAMLDRLLLDVLAATGRARHAACRDRAHRRRAARASCSTTRHWPSRSRPSTNPPTTARTSPTASWTRSPAWGVQGDAIVVHYQLIEHFVLGACLFDGDGAPDNWGGPPAALRTRRLARVPCRGTRPRAVRGASPSRRSTPACALLLDACEASAVGHESLTGAEQAARQRAGELVVGDGLHAGAPRGHVAAAPSAPAAGRRRAGRAPCVAGRSASRS